MSDPDHPGNAGDYRVRKILSPNDVGATGSHQAGICVPLWLAEFFPPLDETRLNPDTWIQVDDDRGNSWQWRFLHYNNGVIASGTRNEYRLTHTTQALRELAATAGDELELDQVEMRLYRLRLYSKRPAGGILVLSTSGPWRTVTVARR